MDRELKTVAQFAADTNWTEAQIRWWLFQAATNGMDAQKVRYKIGRRVYIDPAAFGRWIDAQQPQAVRQ